jgi:hypothetical protein
MRVIWDERLVGNPHMNSVVPLAARGGSPGLQAGERIEKVFGL